eukprot:gene10779-17797_t
MLCIDFFRELCIILSLWPKWVCGLVLVSLAVYNKPPANLGHGSAALSLENAPAPATAKVLFPASFGITAHAAVLFYFSMRPGYGSWPTADGDNLLGALKWLLALQGLGSERVGQAEP